MSRRSSGLHSLSRGHLAELPRLRVALLALTVALTLGADCGGYYPGPLGEPGMMGRYYFFPVAPLATGGAQAMLEVSVSTRPGAGACAAPVPEDVPAWTRAESSDPAILTVVSADVGRIAVRSGAAGRAELRLLDEAGTVVERHPIEVLMPTEIRLGEVPSTVVQEGGLMRECPEVFAGRERLVARGALRYAFGGTLVARSFPADRDLGCQDQVDSGSEHAWFSGTAGQGEVVISTQEGVMARRTWTMAAATDVASIGLTVDNSLLRSAGLKGAAMVRASARTATGQTVIAPRCVWRVDPGATVTERERGDGAYLRLTDWADVRLMKEGSVAVSCTIGTASAMTTVRYHL
jgi:hypothetical protein